MFEMAQGRMHHMHPNRQLITLQPEAESWCMWCIRRCESQTMTDAGGRFESQTLANGEFGSNLKFDGWGERAVSISNYDGWGWQVSSNYDGRRYQSQTMTDGVKGGINLKLWRKRERAGTISNYDGFVCDLLPILTDGGRVRYQSQTMTEERERAISIAHIIIYHH